MSAVNTNPVPVTAAGVTSQFPLTSAITTLRPADFSEGIHDGVDIVTSRRLARQIVQVPVYTSAAPLRILASAVLGALIELGTAGQYPALSLLATYMVRRYPSMLEGPRVLGCEFRQVPMPAGLEHYLITGERLVDEQWTEPEGYANQAEIDAALAINAGRNPPVPPVDVPAGIPHQRPVLDAYWPDAPGVEVDIRGVPLNQMDALCGIIIYALRNTADQYSQRQYETQRPEALRKAFGIDVASAGPMGADYPTFEFFEGVSRIGTIANARAGLLISRVVAWDLEDISDAQAPCWATAQLLRGYGMGGLSNALRLMKYYPEIIAGHGTLTMEAHMVRKSGVAYASLGMHDRRFKKAIEGSNFVLGAGRDVANIMGAGRMLNATRSMYRSGEEDYGMRSDVAAHVRAGLAARGVLNIVAGRALA